MQVLEDILSGDATRIWSGASSILRCWDLELLEELVPHIAEIAEKTNGIALGGALHPNSVHLNNALKRLEFVRDRKGCLCKLNEIDQFADPNQEVTKGRLLILETKLQDGYVDFYRCKCLLCGAEYEVVEREYHYTWWGWSAI